MNYNETQEGRLLKYLAHVSRPVTVAEAAAFLETSEAMAHDVLRMLTHQNILFRFVVKHQTKPRTYEYQEPKIVGICRRLQRENAEMRPALEDRDVKLKALQDYVKLGQQLLS